MAVTQKSGKPDLLLPCPTIRGSVILPAWVSIPFPTSAPAPRLRTAATAPSRNRLGPAFRSHQLRSAARERLVADVALLACAGASEWRTARRAFGSDDPSFRPGPASETTTRSAGNPLRSVSASSPSSSRKSTARAATCTRSASGSAGPWPR